MKQRCRGKRISRRRFLRRDLLIGVLGLFAGIVSGLHHHPKKTVLKPQVPPSRRNGVYSKLAG